MDAPWRIEVLGGLRALLEERVITRFRTQSTGLLLAYLACYARAHPREVLAERLWPEQLPRKARDSLNTALSSLRRQLEPPGVPPGAVLASDRFSVRLNPEGARVDLLEFDEALTAARRANSAARWKSPARARSSASRSRAQRYASARRARSVSIQSS
jgi:DNA-binding SARP family transcriptional activator